MLSSTANIIIDVNIPVSPVRTGGILSLHCRVWNLEKSHQVTIFRKLTGKHSEMLSVNEDVLPAIEDRVFLASRQLPDGSAVYFLSITDVTRYDQGTYTCKVMGLTESDDTVTLGSFPASIDVQYFPSDTYPSCSPSEALTLTEGKLTVLNCSTEKSNPTVEMKWIKTGADEMKNAKISESNGIVYSELEIIPRLSDQGKMFICEITSPIFPDYRQSCHVGPLTIIKNPKYTSVVTPPSPINTKAVITPSIESTIDIRLKTNCLKACPTISSPESFWIVATVVAGIFALTFLLIGIVLVIKYNKMHSTNKRQLPPHLNRDYIYSELEHKPAESQVYMSLEKRDKLSGPCIGQLKGHYHVASLVQPS